MLFCWKGNFPIRVWESELTYSGVSKKYALEKGIHKMRVVRKRERHPLREEMKNFQKNRSSEASEEGWMRASSKVETSAVDVNQVIDV